ncbi:MAG: hypothetical protein JWP29_3513 [Rhodoferax sp.]|nr:hypothetical protein [Rhodoferax sp.]
MCVSAILVLASCMNSRADGVLFWLACIVGCDAWVRTYRVNDSTAVGSCGARHV